MLKFEEELERFAPSLDVDQTAETVLSRDMTDLGDLLLEALQESGEEE